MARRLAVGADHAGAALKSQLLAKIATQNKQYDPAEKFYRLGIKLRRDRAAGLYDELARMLIEARKFAEAVKVLDDAINEPSLKNNRAAFWFLASMRVGVRARIRRLVHRRRPRPRS